MDYLAKLMAIVRGLSPAELRLVLRFAEFLATGQAKKPE
ncbi:hypothetical protein ES705_30897 [subsurface metagenome]|jgi:hypothetical protein